MISLRVMSLLLLQACSSGPENIADALDRACRIERGGFDEPEDGDLHKVTIDEPDAVCNDGTPGVMWIRPASDPAHADDWVIFLAAGGLCSSEAECTVRWCTAQGLMSSANSRNLQVGNGILADDVRNPFGGWNHVSLMYCTSDLWGGQRQRAVLEGTYEYSLSFEGHGVVAGALATLDRGARSDDGSVEAPDLTRARNLVWIGSSAGSHGGAHHLDWVAERYPQTRVVGVFDSLLFPAPGSFPDAFDQVLEETFEDQYREWYTGLYDSFLEPSCVAEGLGEACVQMFVVERDHISTPYLARHDLYDPTEGDAIAALGTTPDEIADASYVSALELEAARPDVSLLVPACANHIVATDSVEFHDEKVLDEEGTAWSLAQAVEALLAGERVVAIDTPESQSSVCVR